MKASILIKAPAIIILSLAFSFTHAQTATGILHHPSINQAFLLSRAYKEKGTMKAFNNFRQSYAHAVDVDWSVLADKSLMCRFVNNGITTHSFYRCNGQWSYTVSDYNENRLDSLVSDRVRSAYYNYSITYVEEIDMPNSEPVYIIEIQDKRSIKKLRVDKEEIEVIKELDRQ